MKKQLHYIIFIFLISFIGCSIPKLPAERKLSAIPPVFLSNIDSLSEATLISNNFFTDKQLRILIDSAIANNNDIRNAFQNMEIAKANTRFARGLMQPVVNAAFLPNLRKFGFYTMDGAGNATTDILPGKVVPVHLPDYFAGLQAAWEPDIYAKLKNQKQSAQFRYLATSEGKNWLQANLVQTIAVNYYELLALDEQLNIIRQNIQLQKEILSIIKVQKEAARTTELAVNQFEAQILNAQALVKEIERAILVNENNINLLLSRYPQRIPRSSDYMQQPIPVLTAGLPSQLLKNRPDIRMAEFELAASRFDVQVARKSFYPTVTINASLGLQAFSPATFFDARSIAYGVFGGLLAPVFNRSALQAQFQTQTALQLQALNNYQQTILTAFGEVYTSLKNIENLNETYLIKQNEANLLERAVANAMLLFQANRADYLEVLTAQQSLLEAKLTIVHLMNLQFQETIFLYKAIGGGWR